MNIWIKYISKAMMGYSVIDFSYISKIRRKVLINPQVFVVGHLNNQNFRS